MTVAIVHDFLTQRGGAERVVLHLANLVKDPVIVTSSYAPDSTYPEFRDLPIWADNLVADRDAAQFRRRAFSYGKAFRGKDLSFADAVIVSSSSFAHHVATDNALVYWYTPPRFLYDPKAYFSRSFMAKGFEVATTGYRVRDKRAAMTHKKNLAVSARTAVRLQASYGLDADVLHPPFDSTHFFKPATADPAQAQALVVSRLLPYKRVEVAIAACQLAGVPLTVIGQGPDEERLRSLAGPTVTFVPGGLSEEELLAAYDSHSVVLNPGIEDFGYIPLESAARGRPVLAASEGGAAETVTEGVTGFLVTGERPDAWAKAIRQSLNTEWSAHQMRRSIERFDSKHFDEGLIRAMCANGDDQMVECFNIDVPVPAAASPSRAKKSAHTRGDPALDDDSAIAANY